MKIIQMKTIRIINDENEQIINLPEEYRFDGEEVCIEKLGDVVIIRPKANEQTDFVKNLKVNYET